LGNHNVSSREAETEVIVVKWEARSRGEWNVGDREVIVELVDVGEQTFIDHGNAQRLEFIALIAT
jgi:alpha-glucosidase